MFVSVSLCKFFPLHLRVYTRVIRAFDLDQVVAFDLSKELINELPTPTPAMPLLLTTESLYVYISETNGSYIND